MRIGCSTWQISGRRRTPGFCDVGVYARDLRCRIGSSSRSRGACVLAGTKDRVAQKNVPVMLAIALLSCSKLVLVRIFFRAQYGSVFRSPDIVPRTLLYLSFTSARARDASCMSQLVWCSIRFCRSCCLAKRSRWVARVRQTHLEVEFSVSVYVLWCPVSVRSSAAQSSLASKVADLLLLCHPLLILLIEHIHVLD